MGLVGVGTLEELLMGTNPAQKNLKTILTNVDGVKNLKLCQCD